MCVVHVWNTRKTSAKKTLGNTHSLAGVVRAMPLAVCARKGPIFQSKYPFKNSLKAPHPTSRLQHILAVLCLDLELCTKTHNVNN